MNHKKTMTAAATAVLLASTAVAQEQADSSLITPISYGETVTGFLRASDDSLQDGSHYRMFVVSGEQGDQVTVALNSLDFNAHILLADSLDTILGDDGDSGGLCNARLSYTLPITGRYIIYATTFSAHEIGEYQLSVTDGAVPPPNNRPCGGFFDRKGVLSAGDSAVGTLGPPDPKLGPSHYQVWGIDVPEGQTVTVDLNSIIFDARLTLYRGFATAIDMNDDGAGACNARVLVNGDGHPHSIVMTSGKEDETGPYVLRVHDGALPIIQESQCEG